MWSYISSVTVYHIYSIFDNMHHKRFNVAMNTWKRMDTIKIPVHENSLKRLCNDETKNAPFVKDIIDSGIDTINNRDNYIILFTNTDCCLIPDVMNDINETTDENTKVFVRKDIPYEFVEPLSYDQIKDVELFPGKDGFSFTKNFWEKHRLGFVDMLFSAELWDFIFYIQLSMFSDLVEIQNKMYHQKHYSKWGDSKFRTTLPSQIHNIKLAKEFLYEHIDYVPCQKHMKEWENSIFLNL